jgi:signal peptidase I
VALGLYLLATTTVQTVRVVGTSMYPSLHDGDLLIASKIDYRVHPIERGDIIILVRIRDHQVLVNGSPLREPYVRAPWIETGDWPGPGPNDTEVVPRGSYFVLGDNRDHSSDSRIFSSIRQDAIDGKAVVRFWPFQQVGLLDAKPSLSTHPLTGRRSG